MDNTFINSFWCLHWVPITSATNHPYEVSCLILLCASIKCLHWNQSISKGIIIKPQQRQFSLTRVEKLRPLFHLTQPFNSSSSLVNEFLYVMEAWQILVFKSGLPCLEQMKEKKYSQVLLVLHTLPVRYFAPLLSHHSQWNWTSQPRHPSASASERCFSPRDNSSSVIWQCPFVRPPWAWARVPEKWISHRNSRSHIRTKQTNNNIYINTIKRFDNSTRRVSPKSIVNFLFKCSPNFGAAWE